MKFYTVELMWDSQGEIGEEKNNLELAPALERVRQCS